MIPKTENSEKIHASTCVGVILAGGKSRRFGTNKALALIPSKNISLIQYLHSLLNEIFEKTVVVLHEPSTNYRGMNTLYDRYSHQGPMNGICSALEETIAPAIFVVACDLANLQAIDIFTLWEYWNSDLPALAYQREKRWEPLCAFYSRKILPQLQIHLQKEELSLQKFLTKIGARAVEYTAPKGKDTLININTPADYQDYLLKL